MLCSIIIALYNKEEYVQTAINSVLEQTHQHFEIIVINDGSTDHSAELVASMNDSRIRLIHQKNGGVSRARNRGIDEARGSLVFFLDADDWYDKHYLETIVDMAETYPNGSFYATNFKAVTHFQSDDWDSIDPLINDRELITDFYKRRQLSGPFFCTNSVTIWKRDLLSLQPCFPLNESLGEDQDLWFRLADRLALVYCPAKLAAYQIGVAGSLCNTNELDVLPPVFSRLESRAKQGLIKVEARSSALQLVAFERISVARQLLSKNQRGAALTELFKGFRGITLKRWWVTFIICCLGSPGMMKKWVEARSKNLPA